MSHAVVIGAGVFGTWTAHHLLASGMRVTLIDAYGAANSRSSSGGESRILRCGYGPDAIYSRFAWRSLELWRGLQARVDPTDRPLWHQCGVLWLPREEDPYTIETRTTLESAGYPVRVLDRDALRTRYPHLDANDLAEALLEPECGVLMARRSVRALTSELMRDGVRGIRARVAMPRTTGRLAAVRVMDGREVAADVFVFACGAWLPKVFPDLLATVIRPTRQVIVFFGTPAGDDRFGPAHTPAWVDFQSGIYGVPDLEERGLKVGIDAHGPPFDPDHDDRTPDAGSIHRARDWVRRRFPSMADAPVVETRVCQYENTATGDFLIDRHPEHENVWIVGGGSGHGFKHGPAVGEYAARLVTTGAAPDARFSLASKQRDPGRVVF